MTMKSLIKLLLFAPLMVFMLIVSTRSRVEGKPLNQNQVKFRRLPPKEFSAALGSTITIECEAGASPPPTIHWLKNGIRIIQNDLDENQLEDGQGASGFGGRIDDVNRIALSSTRSRLFIDCAHFDDEAVYTCVAGNEFSRISSHTKLNLIRPVSAISNAGGSENELPLDELLDVGGGGGGGGGGIRGGELNQLELISSSSSNLDETETSLSALPQCLQNPTQSTETLRIHMWTHNIVEVMRNNVLLYCRSNAKKPLIGQSSDLSSSVTNLEIDSEKSIKSSFEHQQHQNDKKLQANVSWLLPDDKQVSINQKDKYEILETGDLLIKDLRWADMGNYVCTISDGQSSDSISSFVYPASVKANGKRATLIPKLAHFR